MSRTPVARPTLLPGLPRIWRTPHTLQLGIDPARAVLLDLPDPRAAHLLDLLDGSRPERAAVAQAGSRGVHPDEAAALLDALHRAGLVVPARSLFPAAMPSRLTLEAAALAFTTPPRPPAGDRRETEHPPTNALHRRAANHLPADAVQQRAADHLPAHALRRSAASHSPADALRRRAAGLLPADVLRRRAAARVVVTGASRLAAGVAVALAEAGTGHVHPDLSGTVTHHETPGTPLTEADAERPRAEAVLAAIERAVPGTRTRAVRRGAASLVIQLGSDHPAVTTDHRTRPHLPAVVREGAVIVGPLLLSSAIPCPNCLARHRADRDAQWPAPPPVATASTGLEPCAVATLLAATAFLTAEALTLLNGERPETFGAEVVMTAPGRTRRRTWPPHPACSCSRRVLPPERRRTPGADGAIDGR